MSEPLAAVACALYEAFRRSQLRDATNTSVEDVLPREFTDLGDVDQRAWLEVAREACWMAVPIAAIAKRVKP